MPYQYTFTYQTNCTPKSYVTGCTNNVARNTAVVGLPGLHLDGFLLHFQSFNIDADCPSGKEILLVANIFRPPMKLTTSGTRKPLRKFESSNRLTRSIFDLFMPSGESVRDLKAGTMTLALAAMRKERKRKSLEKDKFCFNTAIARLATIFEFTVVFEKASCSSEGFAIEETVRRMYGSDGYVCDDEEE